MDNLKPIIFLFPTIALTLIIVLYIYLLKKATNRKVFIRFVLMITILAFLLNFSWELMQMPLYNSASFTINHITFCALGSVADAIMVLLIYFSLAVIFKNPLWIHPLQGQRIIIVILIGGIGAALSEMRHLSLGNWAYSNLMPLIPIINVGISPVLQFMLLPILTYILSFKILLLKDI